MDALKCPLAAKALNTLPGQPDRFHVNTVGSEARKKVILPLAITAVAQFCKAIAVMMVPEE